MRAVVLSIGSELVTGLSLDTHARDIARLLAGLGADVLRHVTLDDDAEAIARAFREGAADADLVIATGGLGPTADDRTRDGLAAAMEAPLEENPKARAALEAWAASRGRTLSPSNLRQIMLPRGAEPLSNPAGTACGIAARIGACRVFCMPGVPNEMRRMLAEEVLPRVREKAERGTVSMVRTVRTFGMPESELGERIVDLMARDRRPRAATAVHLGIIDIHLHATGLAEEVERLLEADVAEIRQRLGRAVFAEGETPMEEAVADLLAERGVSVALAESCTGGLITAWLVAIPGASDWLLEGDVVYSNAAKTRVAGVPGDLIDAEGAVSEAVARALAEGIRAASGADLALSVSGIAGPTGGSLGKPVGTVWFGLAHAGGTETVRHVFPGDRAHVRHRAAYFGLHLLRLHLAG